MDKLKTFAVILDGNLAIYRGLTKKSVEKNFRSAYPDAPIYRVDRIQGMNPAEVALVKTKDIRPF